MSTDSAKHKSAKSKQSNRRGFGDYGKKAVFLISIKILRVLTYDIIPIDVKYLCNVCPGKSEWCCPALSDQIINSVTVGGDITAANASYVEPS